ncbi:MAG: NAD-dependent epimerase/dehydratase family protein [Desulfocapsaceae bacterium]|jgi:nucleoside-diphosphate-sugar epimerase|nr:NAD-dependent epimerase/dehydratase family protein [Desulfocapsaceae bacterium]
MKKILVTGGGGFVGGAIVRALTEKGYNVTAVGRTIYPELKESGISCRQGDIGDKVFTMDICSDVDTVFHVAAKAGIWGRWQDYYHTNVIGTKNIVDSCRAHGVSNLVYTSTPSVVFDNRDILGGDETLPYPRRFLCNYAKSKVMAETYVLANNSPMLRSCAIRPHLIWGPGDPHLVPRLIEKGKAKALKIIGSGENFVDISYIDNVVHAHLLAAENIDRNGNAAGKAYFIGQESPVRLWDWINDLYSELGIERIVRTVPFRAAFIVGDILEIIHTLGRKQQEPRMTRFLAQQLARSHYFSHRLAARDLGYEPLVSLQVGQKKLLHWLKENDQHSNL